MYLIQKLLVEVGGRAVEYIGGVCFVKNQVPKSYSQDFQQACICVPWLVHWAVVLSWQRRSAPWLPLTTQRRSQDPCTSTEGEGTIHQTVPLTGRVKDKENNMIHPFSTPSQNMKSTYSFYFIKLFRNIVKLIKRVQGHVGQIQDCRLHPSACR